MATTPSPSSEGMKTDEKPLVRLSALIIRNSTAICTTLLLCGALGLLAAPLASRKMFFDENAMLPGGAAVSSGQGGAGAYGTETFLRRARDALEASGNSTSEGAWQSWLASEMASLGIRSQIHVGARHSCQSTVGILEPGRGDGKEAIVLVTPVWDASNGIMAGATSLSAAFRLLSYLRGVPWLAKNVIWLAPDGSCGVSGSDAVADWLDDYYGLPRAPAGPEETGRQQGQMMMRAGRIQQALAIEMPPIHGGKFNAFHVLMQGPRGELPNLDMVQLASWSARRYAGAPLELVSDGTARPAAKVFAARLLSLAGLPAPLWPGQEQYVADLGSMASFLALQLVGESTGPHSPFRSYGADAVTLRPIVKQQDSRGRVHSQGAAAAKLSEVTESVVHSCSNLLEAFHHSYNMYTMLGSERFITPEAYLVPAGLILAALCIQAAAVKAGLHEGTGASNASSGDSQSLNEWLSAVAFAAGLRACSWVAAAAFPGDYLVATYGRLGNVMPGFLRDLLEQQGQDSSGTAPLLLSSAATVQASVAAAALAVLGLLVLSGPAAPWQKSKVVMLTFLSTEAAAVGCVNWVLAFVAVVSLAPGALLCCPWRASAAATNAMSSTTQQECNTTNTQARPPPSLLQRAAAAVSAALVPIVVYSAISAALRVQQESLAAAGPEVQHTEPSASLTSWGPAVTATAALFGPSWCGIISIGLQTR